MKIDPATIFGWDPDSWEPALDFWTRHSRLDPSGLSALEVGSGEGGLSLWLASRGARVVCSDLCEPSARARRLHRTHGLAGAVRYQRIDATELAHAERFDIVLFRSVLGAIGRSRGADGQKTALRRIHRALKPGGELWFAENLVASPLHRLARERFRPWGKDWKYISLAQMELFLEPFSGTRLTTTGLLAAFGRTAWQQSLLSKLDRSVFASLAPTGWRYILIGVARK